ncbi:MAG: hypothetical protein ACYC8T_12465, partial [Myxococcaceae bacterium]
VTPPPLVTPPATSTSPLGSNVALCRRRAALIDVALACHEGAASEAPATQSAASPTATVAARPQLIRPRANPVPCTGGL